jgi:hypothetical protein
LGFARLTQSQAAATPSSSPKYNGFQERSEGLAGAVQSRLDGSRVDAQMPCHLLGVEFLNVAQDENLSVRIG